MPEQLTFDLPTRPALGREDFLVAPSNADALAMIEAWAAWPNAKLVLSAPPGAGKTHLAHVWARAAGAAIQPARDLPAADIPALAAAPVAVENADAIAGDRQAEDALFHLHNVCGAQGTPLMLTARSAPSRWGLALPDLASRLEATMLVTIAPPDDTLLAGMLFKHFADRQLDVGDSVIRYLVARMERSAAAAGAVAAALDSLSLTEKRPVTRRLAARVLDMAAAPAS